MSQHRCYMALVSDIPISLPDVQGKLEKIISYACCCGLWATFNGVFTVGVQHTFTDLIDRIEQEQQEGITMPELRRRNTKMLDRQRRLQRAMR